MAARAAEPVRARAAGSGISIKSRLLAVLTLLLLSGCISLIPNGRPSPPVPLTGSNAALVGTHRGPLAAGLGFRSTNASAALAAFAASCPRLTRRTDATGLTKPDDWAPACAAASGWPPDDAANFFGTYFETATVARGEAFVTGYYEPEIAGVRTRQPGFGVPVYAMRRRCPSAANRSAAMMRPSASSPSSTAPPSKTGRWQARDSRSRGWPIRQSSSFCKCRGRAACARPMAP